VRDSAIHYHKVDADNVADFFAHSNYTELALIELGEQEIFPHVGRDTKLRIPGARHEVYPIVTGTFGGVDFLHSVTGECKTHPSKLLSATQANKCSVRQDDPERD
jgi:hypothetical protein